jgi:hypothetical protein
VAAAIAALAALLSFVHDARPAASTDPANAKRLNRPTKIVSRANFSILMLPSTADSFC